jgi:hypothetical protein
MQKNSSLPHGTLYGMDKALVIGNGESRSWFKPCHQHIFDESVVTWGCNAIYRDGMNVVDNLVAVDYGMQQEIYDSGWCDENPEYSGIHNVHFANWSPVPAEVADMMFMGYDIPEAFIHKSKNRTSECVIQGKDPVTLQEKIEVAIQMNPNLDIPDLVQKMEKDVGVWITYTNDMNEVGIRDVVTPIDFPIGWSTGNTAMHLACQSQPAEVYMLGFDLSSYDEPLNNLYKGTNNYLPSDSKGFNSENWFNQMHTIFKEFKDINFYWVDPVDYQTDLPNVKPMTMAELCEELKIV